MMWSSYQTPIEFSQDPIIAGKAVLFQCAFDQKALPMAAIVGGIGDRNEGQICANMV